MGLETDSLSLGEGWLICLLKRTVFFWELEPFSLAGEGLLMGKHREFVLVLPAWASYLPFLNIPFIIQKEHGTVYPEELFMLKGRATWDRS